MKVRIQAEYYVTITLDSSEQRLVDEQLRAWSKAQALPGLGLCDLIVQKLEAKLPSQKRGLVQPRHVRSSGVIAFVFGADEVEVYKITSPEHATQMMHD